jgi:hypothetical protein
MTVEDGGKKLTVTEMADRVSLETLGQMLQEAAGEPGGTPQNELRQTSLILSVSRILDLKTGYEEGEGD